LFALLGQDGEELAAFAARLNADFEAAADAQNVVDTGVTRPTIPGSCSDLTPAIDNADNAFNAWADELQTCSDNDAWLASQLATACEVPTGDAQALIDSESGRVQAAQDEQVGVLEALMVFKGIHGETLPQFETRLRSVFDKYVTHRSNTHITVPTYPDGCTATDPVVADLEDLISEIADEETFLKWIKANLRACCDDRQDDIEDLVAVHAPMVAGLEARRDELLESLYSFKGAALTLEEYVAQTDATYGAALAAGDVLEGFSSIMDLVPEVPELCNDESLQNSAVARQQELIIIANAIEALEAQIGWLEPLLEQCCLDLEPALQDILDGNVGTIIMAQVGHDVTANDDALMSLFVMAANDGEDFDAFKLRIEGEVQALIDDGSVTAADPGIAVPLISDMCPTSTRDLHAEATAFAVNQILQQTMGAWLPE
jgi:hypothetical protein